jgi:hypothetical protein
MMATKAASIALAYFIFVSNRCQSNSIFPGAEDLLFGFDADERVAGIGVFFL